MKRIISIFLGVIGLVNTGYAALNEVVPGLINDTTQNITWLKDGNIFKKLCDAMDPNASGFATVDAASPASICSANGRMSWNDAEAWIAHLNSGGGYLGYTDWRQPATVQPDASCDSQASGQDFGYNCTAVGNELSHMFNVSLANPDNGDGSHCYNGSFPTDLAPDDCFQNVGPFTNAYDYLYWSGTEYAPNNTTVAWYFTTANGYQYYSNKGSSFYVWPVRSGNAVAAVPPQPVPTMTIWGLGILAGLIGFIGFSRRRMK